jgi:hypothetical protein
MAVLWDGDAAQLAAEAAAEDPARQLLFDEDTGIEIDELERLGLIGRGEPGGTPRRGGATFVDASSIAVPNLTLTGPGKRLYELMGLKQIPQDAREELLLRLWRIGAQPG